MRVSASLHNLEHFFTLSHILPLHDSHLNTGLLIAKIQANLAGNKANKMVDKIQPYKMVCKNITVHINLELSQLDIVERLGTNLKSGIKDRDQIRSLPKNNLKSNVTLSKSNTKNHL